MTTIRKTKIPWATHAWPVYVGCRNGCAVGTCGYDCYAKRDFHRYQHCYPEMKGKFENVSFIEKNFNMSFPKKPARIFINPSSDPEYWSVKKMQCNILPKINGNTEHVFMILTKNPVIYWAMNHLLPKNLWLGVTVNSRTELLRTMDKFGVIMRNRVKFLSLEPIREEIPIELFDPDRIDWLIVGGQSGPGERFYPSVKYIIELEHFCMKNDIPLFIKPNLEVMKKSGPSKYEDMVVLTQEYPQAVT